MAKKTKKIEMTHLLDFNLIKQEGWIFSINIKGEKREFRTDYEGICLYEYDSETKNWNQIEGEEFSLSSNRKKAYDQIYKKFFELKNSKSFGIRINRLEDSKITDEKIKLFLEKIEKFRKSK